MRRADERGFALLLIFLLASMIAIGLYLEMPRVALESQRQKEQLLIERGEQYKRAIQVFVRTNGRYPGKIEDLENFNNRRFLRHRFVDPMTGKAEWRLIHINGGIFIDSIANKGKNGTQNSASTNNFVGEQAYIAPDTPTSTPGAAGAGRRRQSEGGAVPIGPDGQPLVGANGGQPGAPGGAPFNGQFPDPQANLNGQPGAGQPVDNQQQFIQGVPGTPGQPPPGSVPGFPRGVSRNPYAPYPGVPGQPDATGNGDSPAFQPRQVVNQQGVAQPGFQPGGSQQQGFQQPGFQQPGFQQPGFQQPGFQQPGFQQNGVPFGGQPAVNNQAAVGSSSFVGSGQSFVGSNGGFVGSQQTGAVPTPANPNPIGFPNSFPNSPQNLPFGQQNGFPQQTGQAPFNGNPGDFNNPPNGINQPNLPQGGATPYGQPNPGTPNAAADLINGILTNARPGGQPAANPAPTGQQLGGGVAGVASTAEAPAIMVYNERSNYNEWEFIFDLSKQRGLNRNMPMPGQIASAPLTVGTGSPGVAPSGPVTNTPVPAGAQAPLQSGFGGGLNAGGAGPVIPGQVGPGQVAPGQNPLLPGQQQGGLPPGFRLGRP